MESQEKREEREKKAFQGPLAWMAHNHVAANLLMMAFLVAGLLMFPDLKRELMPNVEAERISITARYPGSTPDEVEEGIVIAIEEAVRGLDGVRKVTSTSSEGSGSVILELQDGADIMRTRNLIERQIQQVSTFPDDMEKPIVREMTRRTRVMSILVSGDIDRYALREAAEQVRDELLAQDGISVVELDNVESPEISVEVTQEALQSYGIKISEIASLISSSSIDLSAGNLKAESGAVVLRTEQRRRFASDFERVVVRTHSDGRNVYLGDIAKISEGFEESDYSASYEGVPAISVSVYYVGEETPIGVSDVVNEYLESRQTSLPDGIFINVRNDRAESYRIRIDLLMSNAKIGLLLVLVFLGIFLEIRIAFWAAVGMTVAFVGSISFMVMLGVSFNMISLFAFILALGIVVDDSIVVGEAVYVRRQAGESQMRATLLGLQDVSTPVIFSVLTTIIAFIPLLFLPGMTGKTYRDLPIIVIIVLSISIFEVMTMMPAHLAGLKTESVGFLRLLRLLQIYVANAFEIFVERYMRRVISFAIRNRYAVVAFSLALLLSTAGYISSNRLRYTMMPEVEGDTVTASIRMPLGSPVSNIQSVEAYVLAKTEEVIKTFGRENVRGVYSQISGGSSASIQCYLTPATERKFVSSEFAAEWRKAVGEIAGVEALSFRFNTGPGSHGAGAQFQLSHRDSNVLDAASEDFARRLKAYDGVRDVDINNSPGKSQLSYKLRPEARSLGITEQDFARQLRAAVYGAEALRQQRGRNEVKVFVRYPEDTRQSEALVENFLLRTPTGGMIPLSEAATIQRGFSFRSISRENGKRIVTVSAELDSAVTTVELLSQKLINSDMIELQESYPGLTLSLGGMQADAGEMWSKMTQFFFFSIFVIFAMMATAFRSYFQPLMILVSIPFGFVGAILGHIALGYHLSLISILGMIALSGVVINASIILTSVINDKKREGLPLYNAVLEGTLRRFRPIFLSTMTTFLGVFPMILESSKEARFLIPMAISLGIGVLFSAIITIFLVPCNYIIASDIQAIFKKSKS